MSPHQRHMIASSSNVRDGVDSMERSQVEKASGSKPRKGLPSTTGSSNPSTAREGWNKATGILNIMHTNAERVQNKKSDLQHFVSAHKIDICCIQETHLHKDLRFSIRGYIPFRADRESTTKGETLTLLKNTIAATEIHKSSEDNTEIIGIKAVLKDIPLTVYNTYSPSNKPLQLHGVNPPQENFLIVGDLNSHSPSWGYKDLDQKGEDLEDWMTENSLVLINKPDDPPTWRTTSTPDLAMGTDDVAKTCTRTFGEQLGGSDHKPCNLTLDRNTGGQEKKGKPRWNYKKAKWKDFKEDLEIRCKKFPYQGNNLSKKVDNFTQAVLQSAQNAIPRGFRKNLHPWLG